MADYLSQPCQELWHSGVPENQSPRPNVETGNQNNLLNLSGLQYDRNFFSSVTKKTLTVVLKSERKFSFGLAYELLFFYFGLAAQDMSGARCNVCSQLRRAWEFINQYWYLILLCRTRLVKAYLKRGRIVYEFAILHTEVGMILRGTGGFDLPTGSSFVQSYSLTTLQECKVKETSFFFILIR